LVGLYNSQINLYTENLNLIDLKLRAPLRVHLRISARTNNGFEGLSIFKKVYSLSNELKVFLGEGLLQSFA